MKHVVFCVQNLSVPQDTRVWREALALKKAGYDVSVICPRSQGEPWRETIEGVGITRFPSPPDLTGVKGQILETAAALVFTCAIALFAAMRGRIDVLHGANPPDTFFVVAALLRPFGTKYVFDQHDLVPELLAARGGSRSSHQGRLFKALERLSYRQADMVITPNNSYRAVAIDRGMKDPSQVIAVRSGPDAVVTAATAPGGDEPTIVFAGVIGPQDGVETFIDAVAELRKLRTGPFRVEMIGRGSDIKRLAKRAASLGVDQLITWTGWVGQDELHSRLRKASVGVSPDDDNPFARKSTMTKIAEYLAVGLPVVIADLPENRVTASDCGLYYQPGNAGDMAKRLDEVLRDRELAQHMANSGINRAHGLTWQHSAVRLVAAYDWLLTGATHPSGDQPVASYQPLES